MSNRLNIAITNHTGTRNRGCHALVSSKIKGLRQAFADRPVDISVHSNDPVYDEWRLSKDSTVYWSYLTNTPNHFSSWRLNRTLYGTMHWFEKMLPVSVRSVRVKTITACRSADLIIPTGGDIFTSDYQNLFKHLAYLNLGTKKNVILCGHTVGPFSRNQESYFKKSLKNVAGITVRESVSYDYLKTLRLDIPLEQTADVAFGLSSLPKNVASEYLRCRYGIEVSGAPLVGISVSQGVIRYSNLNSLNYYDAFAGFIDHLNTIGRQVILIPHVIETKPDKNDVIACEQVYGRVKDRRNNRIILGEPDAVEMKGLIGLCECLIGTRTHATIASMSQGVPTVSIAYSRKAYGIMKDFYGETSGDALTIDVKNLSTDQLVGAYEQALNTPIPIEAVEKNKRLAERNFSFIREIAEGLIETRL